MNNTGAFILLLAVAALIAVVFVLRSRKKKGAGAEAVANYFDFDLPEEPPFWTYSTPAGVVVRAYKSISRQAEVFAAIDAGVRAYLRSTESRGWIRFRRPMDFEVWLLPQTSTSIEGFPGLLTRSGQKISGIAIGVVGYVLENPFVCVAFNETHFDWLRDACRAEFEHVGDMNDPALMTEHTQPGHQHFFYTDGEGFSARNPFVCGCAK